MEIWILYEIENGDDMVTGLDMFKKEMEPARQLFTREILSFTKQYDSLGKMTLTEIPDIDTQDYVYQFEKVDGISQKELDEIYWEISNHMEEFSKIHGIEKFFLNVSIWL